MPTIPTELTTFLIWLASSAGVGAVMSEFFEGEEWFDKLKAQTKNRIVLFVSIALGIVAGIVISLPPETLAKIAPIAAVIIGSIAVYLTSQRYHDTQHTDVTATNLSLNVSTTTPSDTSSVSSGTTATQNINAETRTANSGQG